MCFAWLLSFACGSAAVQVPPPAIMMMPSDDLFFLQLAKSKALKGAIAPIYEWANCPK